jgi:hypothetical protein
MDVLLAHFEEREPMAPGFSGAEDKLYVPLSEEIPHEKGLMIVLSSSLGTRLILLDLIPNQD